VEVTREVEVEKVIEVEVTREVEVGKVEVEKVVTATPAPLGSRITIDVNCASGEMATAMWLLLLQFEEEHPDIAVNLQPLAYGTSLERMTLDFATGGGFFDVTVTLDWWMTKVVKGDYLLPIDDYIVLNEDELSMDDIIPALQALYIFDDKAYGFPLHSSAQMLYFRRDVLEREGYEGPETWDEFAEVAEHFYRPGEEFYGVAESELNLWLRWFEWLRSQGLDILDERDQPQLNVPESLEFLNYWQRLYEWGVPDGKVASDDELASHFLQGEAALLIQWDDVGPRIRDLERSTVDVKQVGFGILPKGRGPKAQNVTFGTAWAPTISKYSDNPDEAFEYLKWLTIHDKDLFETRTGLVPCRLSTFDDPALATEEPYMTAIADALKVAKSMPRVAEYSEMINIVQVAASKVINGQATSEQGVAEAQSELVELIRREE